MATDKIIGFQRSCPELDIKYIPIQGRMSIGQKRNLGVDQADHEIILFMDDDDHYPPTSFRRRVAWLLYGEKRGQSGFARIACCTTIAMYDLRTGISAVNVPPMSLPFCQRISEATLTFVKSAWTERPFSEVSVAEGEEWIRGREQEVLEMPPQQIIVAFSHAGNQSGRRIPPKDQAPSCFWGFSRDYLSFIHGLVGVEIEDAKVASPSTRRR
jgi:glycosyltransferase involved in cell wall biosynthesis